MADHTPTTERHHSVLINSEYGSPRVQRLLCEAPPEAMCHAVWTCECERLYDLQMRNGVPAHRPYAEDPDTWHAGMLDPTYCAYRDWAEASDEWLLGEVKVPVQAAWEGDFYEFTLDPAAHDRKIAAEAWDAAVKAMRYEDGTPVELVSVVNPYRADRIEQGGA